MVRAFAAIAICLLLPAAAQDQRTVFRSGVQTVVLHATVRGNDGRLAPALRQEDFEIRDEGRPVDITVFSADVQPITVALLLDMSGSMTEHFLRVRDATKHFIDALQLEDRARIGSFGVEVALSPWLTSDKRILHRVLSEELWPGGGTPMWTAIHAAMQSLDGEPGRRVILTLTDGISSMNLPGHAGTADRVRSKAEDDGFMVYAIGIEGSPLDRAITSLADRTGGGHFTLESGADLAATFLRVVDELRHQYVLGFSPTTADGKLHDLDVRVKKPGMSVRARKNYRAPERKR
jgi:Ca-activated chloride channel family protein